MVERSIGFRQEGGSIPPTSKKDFSAGSGIDARTLHICLGGVSSSGRAADLHLSFLDVVTEWLTCLTRNQILSGAQVQILPTSCFASLSFLKPFVQKHILSASRKDNYFTQTFYSSDNKSATHLIQEIPCAPSIFA